MDQIRKAAFHLFSKYGVQKVNIQEIAKKANVSQVTIYNYFGSKDDLVYDVMKDFMDKQLQAFIEIKDSELTFKEKLEKLFSLKIEGTKELSPEFLEAILSEHSQIAKLFQEFAVEKSLPLLFEFFEEGKREGFVSPELSMNTILFILQSLTDSVQKAPENFQTVEQRDQFTKEVLHFFFYGIMNR